MNSSRTTLIIVIALSLTACSIGQISKADSSSIHPGATRKQVEQILGENLRRWTLSGGVTYRVYKYRLAQIAISYNEDDIVQGAFPDFHDFDEPPPDGRSKTEIQK